MAHSSKSSDLDDNINKVDKPLRDGGIQSKETNALNRKSGNCKPGTSKYVGNNSPSMNYNPSAYKYVRNNSPRMNNNPNAYKYVRNSSPRMYHDPSTSKYDINNSQSMNNYNPSTSKYVRNNPPSKNRNSSTSKYVRNNSPYSQYNVGNRNIKLGYKKLEEISQQDSVQILQYFNDSKNFEIFSKIDLKPDTIVMLMKCMKQMSLAEFDVLKAQTLIKICKSQFLKGLKNYIIDLHHTNDNQKQNNSLFWNNINIFFEDLFLFCQSIIDLSPSTAADEFRSLFDVVAMSIEGFSKYQKETFNEGIIKMFDEVRTKFASTLEEVKMTVIAGVSKEQNDQQNLQLETPPENFREIRIMPSKLELFNKPNFLRPNIIDGAYQGVEHYLDVQFRLMREDFIGPLRDAISEYRKDDRKTKRRYGSARFYYNVKILNYSTTSEGTGIEICFNERLHNAYLHEQNNKMKNDRSSKRFLYGSLLLLTKNNFNRYIHCTILNSDNSQHGVVTAFLDPRLFSEELFQGTFLMIESDVYFPPYLHILRMLKRPALAQSFPFEEYIIHARALQKPPSYFQDWPADQPYKLFDGHHVLNGIWPNEEELGLDSSQYNAYKMALTREFVTIQGPPGTGKTFIGLKVAQTILKNLYYGRHETNLDGEGERQRPPILVVCYTNHALDQFLEGLLPFTRSLVRVGGQSKSETLRNFNLNKRRDLDISYELQMDELKSVASSLERTRHILNLIKSPVEVYDVTQDIKDINSREFFSKFHLPDDETPPLFNWLAMLDRIGHENIENIEQNPQLDKMNAEKGQILEEDEDSDGDMDLDDIHRQKIDLNDDIDLDNSVVKHDIKSINVHELRRAAYNTEMKLNTRAREPGMDETLIQLEYQKNALRFHMANILQGRLRRGNVGYPANVNVVNGKLGEDYNVEQRWALYWKWCNAVKEKYTKTLIPEMNKLNEQKSACDELQQASHLRCLREAHVVGVTTSGAARLQALLRSLKSPIVIVEEAAEVMETHVIVSVTKHCKHLIMIGDHQQLRPITASYALAKHYNLDISLFERMVKNGNHCLQLAVQHRMRPEISKLITPAIYPELRDHPRVLEYPNVRGVRKNLFFVDHAVHETKVEDSVSRMNEHEAHFALSLAKYLVQQGYRPSDITILAAYSGQMFYLRKELKEYSLLERIEGIDKKPQEYTAYGHKIKERVQEIEKDSVRVVVLDNYQGEENKIIILSLVRSNTEGNIGFLAAANRVCVALSRAKEGFYIIGNMTNLKEKSPLWREVLTVLESQNSVGEYLELQCQIHRNFFTPVKCAEDFVKVAEGGCQNACNHLLRCGHHCKKLCHQYDIEHKRYLCREKCQKIICELNHKCEDLCYRECLCKVVVDRTLECGHQHKLPCSTKHYNCEVLVDDTLPFCGHKVKRLCYLKVENVGCPEPCEDRLSCGHSCRSNCHKNPEKDPDHLKYSCMENCANLNEGCNLDHVCMKRCHEKCSKCTVKVSRVRKCGHTVSDMDCHQNVDDVMCYDKCKRSLPCGHHCKLKCGNQCDPTKCEVKVVKVRPSCGHEIKTACGKDPDKVECRHPCNKIMSCGHKCNRQCYMTCDIGNCKEMIANVYESVCGHSYKIPCNESRMDPVVGKMTTMKYCDVPCDKILKGCDHKCSGSCGKCWAGTLHVPCAESCGNILVCGHACKQPCRLACPPCLMKCEVRCGHSKCPRKCGVPCAFCKEPCKRSCRHGKCKKLCSADCSIPPCSEACDKKMKCGHPCRGLCGDKCPDVCQMCKPDDYPDILFGEEDDKNARFIKLIDCSHVVEVRGMDRWMAGEQDGMIRVGVCPHCKCRVINTPRYVDQVKKVQRNIQAVKSKVFGHPVEIKKRLLNILQQLDALKCSAKHFKEDSDWSIHFTHLYKTIKKNLAPLIYAKGNKNNYINVSLTDVSTYQIHSDILQQISDIFKDKNAESCLFVQYFLKKLLDNVKLCSNKVSEQQSEDFNSQLAKLDLLVLTTDLEFLSKTRCVDENQSSNQELIKTKNDILFSTKLFDEEATNNYKQVLNAIRKSMNLSPITDAERKMIVSAMGLKQGHWYTCRNGHPYCITECGGAMQVSKCPECREGIGGTQHRLLETNRVAGFMDGARHGAWPGNYNMQDYRL